MTKSHFDRTVINFLICILLIITGFAHAQDEQDLAQYDIKVKRFFDYITVLDGDGNFVKGLKADDFVVRVNGTLVKIEDLVEVDSATRDSQVWQQALLKVKGDEDAEQLKELFPPKHLILVFDVFNSTPEANRYARRTARELLDQLLPTDLVSIFQYNFFLRELTPGQPVKPELAGEYIDKLSFVGGNAENSPSGSSMDQMYAADAVVTRAEVEKKKELYQNFLRSLVTIAEGVAHQKMPKRMVVFSEGADVFIYQKETDDPQIQAATSDDTDGMDDNTDMNESMAQSLQATGINAITAQMEVRTAMQSIEKFLAGTDTRIYTVRRGRIVPGYVGSAEQDIHDNFTRSQPNAAVMMDMFENKQESLRRMASLGGGKFYDAGIPQEEFVKSLIEDVGDYYQIIFTVPEKIEDAGFNTIEITHANSDLKVNHKRGFFGFATREYMEKRAKMNLANAGRDISYAKVLNVTSKFYLFPFPEASATMLSVSIDPSRLTLGEGKLASVKLSLSSWDTLGNPVESFEHDIDQLVTDDERVNLNLFLPISGSVETTELRIEDRNSDAGYYVRKTLGMKVSGSTTIAAAEPILLSKEKDKLERNLLTQSEDDRAINLVRDLQGRPLTQRVVKQGETVTMAAFFTDSSREFDGIPENLGMVIVVRTEDNSVYRFVSSHADAILVEGTNIIRIAIDLPLGYSPLEKGMMEIYTYGLDPNGPFVMKLPYSISDYNEGRASKLISETAKIVKMN